MPSLTRTFAHTVPPLPELVWRVTARPLCPRCGAEAAVTRPATGGVVLTCGECGHLLTFPTADPAHLRAVLAGVTPVGHA